MSKVRDISCMDAARMIKHITGFQIAPTEIMWAEYDEETKILKYEVEEDETVWQLNCCTGMSCHLSIRPGNIWTEWEHRHR